MYEGFRIRVPVLAAAIVFAAAGCTSGTVSPPLSTSHSSAPATVQLPEGDVRDSFAFEAPDPRTHYFDVGVTMPIATQLEITFVTADGKILRILDPDKAVAFCAEEDGRLHCLLHYSILEARQPGTWTAQVHKLSAASADVAIGITWMQLDEGDETTRGASHAPGLCRVATGPDRDPRQLVVTLRLLVDAHT